MVATFRTRPAWLACGRAGGGRAKAPLGCGTCRPTGRFPPAQTQLRVSAVTAPALLKSASLVLRQDRPIFGIVLINLAVVVFTSMDAVIKGVSETFPTGELVFFRNLFAFAPILGFIAWQGRLNLRTRHAAGHLMRGLFGVSAMYCYFLSYKLLPLSDAVALGLSGPIFLT